MKQYLQIESVYAREILAKAVNIIYSFVGLVY